MNCTRDLFYLKDETTLFAVVGYVDNSNDVNTIIKMYEDGRDEFAKISGCNPSEVQTIYIDHSRRYKYMRVFYCNNIKTPPKEAFCITEKNGWTMDKWLED